MIWEIETKESTPEYCQATGFSFILLSLKPDCYSPCECDSHFWASRGVQEFWGLLRADLPREGYLAPLPPDDWGLTVSLAQSILQDKTWEPFRHSWEACLEIQIWAECNHYSVTLTVLELITFWKSNLLKIIFLPFILMVMHISWSLHWVTEMGMLISSEERCGPNWQDVSLELYFLIWGGVHNISSFLIREFIEVPTCE